MAGLLLVAAAYAMARPDRALRVATGVVAHDLCSKVFVSGLQPAAAFSETVTRGGIRTLAWGLQYDLDAATKTVRASVWGRGQQLAQFRDGHGCVVRHGPVTPVQPQFDRRAFAAALPPPLSTDIAGPDVVVPSDASLKAAIDHAFEETPGTPQRATKAVVVVRDKGVIAERYAAGVGVDTPLHGFSMTKSVINALLGRLVQQGRLDLSQAAPVAAWRETNDPRHAITVEQLMRMSSGLALDESNSGFDPSSQMVYLQGDMAGFAERARLRAAPGTRWAYSSPSTQLLARIVRESAGGRPEDMLAFAWRELFGPLGMRTALWELDETGQPIGGSYLFASARDWARLGQLYLDDGMAGGRRLLPLGWVDFSARGTLGGPYGAGFWTVRSADPRPRRWAELGMPRDAFFASGELGQRIVVLPSQRLVIVRLGDAVDPTGDFPGLARLVREVIAATRP